jgi:hypothetical protein
MQVDYFDGKKTKEEFDSKEEMLRRAEQASSDPNVKKITLHFPKLVIPKKRRRP